jgi:hypothetical protein
MTANKPNNKSKWTAAGAAAKTAEPVKTAEPAKSAPEAPAPAAAKMVEPAKSAPVAPSVKSEPVAPAPAGKAPLESAAVNEAVIAAALAPQAPDAPEAAIYVEVVELEAAPLVASQESVAGFVISASTPGATPEAAAWAFKGVELWSENAQAMMGFASALGKAKSLTEIVELQSRFASERFNRFAKLASEAAPPPKFFFFAA